MMVGPRLPRTGPAHAAVPVGDNEVCDESEDCSRFSRWARILVCAAFIRVGYKSVGSGGYIYVDIAVPWNR